MNKIEYLKKVDEVIAQGPYKDNWESLCDYPVPKWYQDAKFGIFIHWGVYAVPAFGSEWYPRQMYQEGTKEFEHHVKTYGPHDKFGYKDFIPMFKAEKFNADEWMTLFKEAGARYVMPVAEHHDGFKLYNSDLNRWNSTQMGPCKDIVGELKAAAEKNDIKICVSNHRAEHFWFMDGGLHYSSDVKGAGYDDFYGPPQPSPENHSDVNQGPPSQEHLEDWLTTMCEMVDNYKPYVVWFDWWIQHMAFKPYIKKFAAYYYNRAAEWNMEVAINYKYDAYAYTSALFDIERGQLAEITPRLWQNDTAIAKNSWGYTENNDFKAAPEIISDLVDIVSKNGCLLLNVGPRADGTITEEETQTLKDIGKWLSVNGEGIYDSTFWRIYGEGPTQIPAGAFSDTDRQSFTPDDIRFTFKKGSIYAYVMKSPENGKVSIKALGKKPRLLETNIKNVSVLGSDSAVSFEVCDDCCNFVIANPITSTNPICLKIELF